MHSRSRVAVVVLVFLLLFLWYYFSQENRPIEGVYTFMGNGVEETLQIKPGGVFIQKVKIDNVTFNARGHWSLQNHAVRFEDDFLLRFDTSTGKAWNPPLRLSLGGGYWDSWHDRISLSAIDKDYFVKRTSSN
jgi:hypothetical protein